MLEIAKETGTPTRLVNMMGNYSGIIRNDNIGIFAKHIEKAINEGIISPINPRELIINMIGLCIFPFFAKPILPGIFFQHNKESYKQFMKDRKTEVSKFIINSIKK